MGSEVLLYGYSAVCVSMLVFNIVYFFLLNGRDRRMERTERRFRSRVEYQLDRLRLGMEPEGRHLAYLRRKLSRVGNLMAFDQMMAELREGDPPPELLEYDRYIQPVILHLAMVYRSREDVQAAYFAWFLARNRKGRSTEPDSVQEILIDYMNQDSLYCRVNAFQALCSLGSPQCVARAVAVLDRNRKFFHGKVLTDSLVAFTGSHPELAALLLGQFDSFSDQTRLAVLNYIRFSSGDYCPWVLERMTDPGEDKELRLSAIRYFGRYVYPPAKPALLEFAALKDPLLWEYAAISASALASYEGQDVTDALIGAIYSANWYVRSNAAASLTSRGLGHDDLIAVTGGGDRYVREMMLYQMQLRQAAGPEPQPEAEETSQQAKEVAAV